MNENVFVPEKAAEEGVHIQGELLRLVQRQ
jgi:hypothetical protein